jgi:hypothetical protein
MNVSRKAEFEQLCDLAEDLTRALDGLKRQLEKLAAAEDGSEPAGPRWVSLKRAQQIAGRGRDTMIKWARLFGLGHKLPGGRSAPWVFDEVAILEHLARITADAQKIPKQP